MILEGQKLTKNNQTNWSRFRSCQGYMEKECRRAAALKSFVAFIHLPGAKPYVSVF